MTFSSSNSSIQNFMAKMKTRDFSISRPYLFEVVFLIDPIGAMPNVPQTFSLLCHSANLPGWQVDTVPIRVYGLASEMPTGMQYDRLQVSCYVDNNFKIMQYLDYIRKKASVDPYDYSVVYAEENRDSSKIMLNIFDTDNKTVVASYEYVNAMIVNVTSLMMDWSSVGQLQQVTMNITFDYVVDNVSDANGASGNSLSAAPSGNSFMKAISGGLSNLLTPMNFDTIQSLNPELASGFLASKESPFSQITSSIGNIAGGVINTASSLTGQIAGAAGNVLSGNVNVSNTIADNLNSFANSVIPRSNGTSLMPSTESVSTLLGGVDLS